MLLFFNFGEFKWKFFCFVYFFEEVCVDFFKDEVEIVVVFFFKVFDVVKVEELWVVGVDEVELEVEVEVV